MPPGTCNFATAGGLIFANPCPRGYTYMGPGYRRPGEEQSLGWKKQPTAVSIWNVQFGSVWIKFHPNFWNSPIKTNTTCQIIIRKINLNFDFSIIFNFYGGFYEFWYRLKSVGLVLCTYLLPLTILMNLMKRYRNGICLPMASSVSLLHKYCSQYIFFIIKVDNIALPYNSIFAVVSHYCI